MSLTLEAEQRLDKVSLVTLFDNHQVVWTAAAQRTYDFIEASFPANSVIRQDDVAKALKPVLEVNGLLKAKLARDKLTQRYWVSHFTDLIIDRVWQQISQ